MLNERKAKPELNRACGHLASTTALEKTRRSSSPLRHCRQEPCRFLTTHNGVNEGCHPSESDRAEPDKYTDTSKVPKSE